MFSLRRAFNAGAAACAGAGIALSLNAHNPEEAVIWTLAAAANVFLAGMSDRRAPK
jgi:hypothetical protein